MPADDDEGHECGGDDLNIKGVQVDSTLYYIRSFVSLTLSKKILYAFINII